MKVFQKAEKRRTKMHAILNSPVESSQSLSTNEENPKLQVRIHGVDGSLATFTQEDPAVVYLAIQLVGGHHVYLKVQIMDVPRAERLQRIHAFMELPGLSFRLTGGGLSIVNLTNAVKFSGYPGPPEVPADAWSANEG